jgi:hypothetical protein
MMDRRDFLRAAFASLAVAAIPMPAVFAAVEPATTLPEMAASELWMRVAGEWKFIGMYRRVMFEREPVLTGAGDDGYPRWKGGDQSVQVEVLSDFDGEIGMRDAFEDGGGQLEIAFGGWNKSIPVSFREMATVYGRGENMFTHLAFDCKAAA